MFSPEQLGQLAQLRQVTCRLSAQIKVGGKSLILEVSAPEGDEEALKAASNLVSQLTNQLATQLDALFGIKGEIIELSEG